MSSSPITDDGYREALASVEATLDRLKECTEEEKSKLRTELAGLRAMHDKLLTGRVEIVVFGEISTGKSALINALLGRTVTSVDVRGGWTKELAHVSWSGTGYAIPGLGESQVLLVDTPGINEVGGGTRGELARDAAQRADLILFVTDSDLNDVEHSAVIELAAFHKPLLVVVNKSDLYDRQQRARLLEVLRNDRLREIVPPENFVLCSADPREREYVIQAADGSERSEWRKPPPEITDLKAAVLQLLDKEGLALVALNGALYAADKSDKIASLRVQLRQKQANQVIWGCAVTKALAVGLNPIGVADVFGGLAVDAAMVVALANIYGLKMSTTHAQSLVTTVAQAAGWLTASVLLTSLGASLFKLATVGKGTLLTALPQGAAAGYGSYIVGQAAQYYFEHGSSWGSEGPKAVVQRILDSSDQESILQQLKEEIGKKLLLNRHAGQ